MDTALFEKFNATFDVVGLQKDIANSNSTDFMEVPLGDYEVSIVKLEVGETGPNSKTPGMPQAKVWFKIVNECEFKGQLIFMNQNLTTGFQIHKMNDFLKSLNSGIEIVFVDFVQYAQLLETIFNAIDGHYEYQLSYSKNDKGYNTYTIVQQFQKDA